MLIAPVLVACYDHHDVFNVLSIKILDLGLRY